MRPLDLSRFKNATHLSSGRHSSVFTGSGVEFGGLREYVSGDARSIDWKSSLRSGRTLEKTYVPDREIPVWCVLDVSSSMGYGPEGGRPIDAAIAAFDLMALSAKRYGNPFAALAFSDGIVSELAPTKSQTKIFWFRASVLSAFGRSNPSFSQEFPISELRARIRSKAAVFAFSDRTFEFPAGFERSIRHSHAFFVRIRNPVEEGEPVTDLAAFWRKGISFFPSLAFSNRHDGNAAHSENSVATVEIGADQDPYPALELLLSK